MKTNIYITKNSGKYPDNCINNTNVVVNNHMNISSLYKKIINTCKVVLIVLFFFPNKSFTQGNAGKICLFDGVTSACGSQVVTYSMTSTGGINNPTLYQWTLSPGSNATFCSATNGTTVCVNGAVGTFTLNLMIQGNGAGIGNTATCNKIVTINPLPNCSITGTELSCTSLNNTYNGPNAPAGKTYSYYWAISGAVNSSLSGSTNSQSLVVNSGSCNASYNLFLTVTDLTTGCISECNSSFGYIDNIAPVMTSAGSNTTIDCPATPIFSTPTATDACSSATVIEISDITEGEACHYTRTKTWKAVDACGNESEMVSQAITVQDVTSPSISGEGEDIILEDCHAEIVFTAPTALDLCDPNPIINIVSTTTVQNADGSVTQTRTWNATDQCNNVSSNVNQSITISTCRSFCTFSQGYYGNNNGFVLLPNLLSQGDIIIGKPGKSFTIKMTDALCLNNNLPSGGTPKLLPTGDAVYDVSCSTSTAIPLRNGRFDNILLGQTITLGLNLRNDIHLGGLILNGNIITTSSGSKSIPQNVIIALMNIYGNKSVMNLYDLANRALGGLNIDAASLSSINEAVSSINESFDECQTLISFDNSAASRNQNNNEVININNQVRLNAIPNPFNESTKLEFTIKSDSKVKVEIYNVTGTKIATLFDDDVKANQIQSVTLDGHYLSNGIYIYALTTNENTYYHKLLFVK